MTRGPFLESPGNLTDPKSDFEIKVSRKVGSVLTSNEVHFVSLADNFTAPFSVIFQKRVRVFYRGFKHGKTDESTRPQAECFYCFRVFETPMKHEARVFEITSPTKEN